jgi:hypothetical protein
MIIACRDVTSQCLVNGYWRFEETGYSLLGWDIAKPSRLVRGFGKNGYNLLGWDIAKPSRLVQGFGEIGYNLLGWDIAILSR